MHSNQSHIDLTHQFIIDTLAKHFWCHIYYRTKMGVTCCCDDCINFARSFKHSHNRSLIHNINLNGTAAPTS